MARNIIALILCLTLLVACAAPQAATPTRIPIAPSRTPFLPTEAVLPIGDGGLISGQPCEAPCFFGIRIGETPFDQVIPLLKKYGISPCSVSSDTTVFCGENTNSIAIGADPSTMKVDGIQYDPGTLITVEEIIRKYGNPSAAYVTSGDLPEDLKTSVLLLWDSIRMRVDLPEVEEENYAVKNTSQIQSIVFLDEESYNNLAAGGFAQSWKGYSVYQPDLDQ